jgi:RNA polymerase sigma factor (TIGR02999 family)
MSDDSSAVTILLRRWQGGESDALEELTPLVYQELRRIAGSFLRRERSDHTLQATALLHEAYMRLAGQNATSWKDRTHFFGVAAHLMRMILVDHARSKAAEKRGGGLKPITLEETLSASSERPADLVALDDALMELEKFDSRKSKVIELRYFGGMTIEEASEVLGISTSTLVRDQRLAEAWIQRFMLNSDTSKPD